MKKTLNLLLTALGLIMALLAYPAVATLKAGVDYQVLEHAQPVEEKGKIEIIEFFWYGCPHCYKLEPLLADWRKRQGANVTFKQAPVAFNKDLEPHQRLYYALAALGKQTKLMPKIFQAILIKKNSLLTPTAQADFLTRFGVSRKQFLNSYYSFATQIQVRRVARITNAYPISGVPAIAVQGKYLVSPAITANSLARAGHYWQSEEEIFQKMFITLDMLITQIRAKKL
jgi:protein dithiol oxidoreductase (disulfide-forming)